MKNVLDIKAEKRLDIVLPKSNRLGRINFNNNRSVIIIHLYYLHSIDTYMKYTANIPEEIDICFTYSDEAVKKRIEGIITQTGLHCSFVHKENRGRDISALLVACRSLLHSYKYICFLHDKKETNPARQEDNEAWVYSLWENMIGSREYIDNILFTFQQNPELGLAAPPAIISGNLAHGYTNQWSGDYAVTEKLAGELQLNCDLNINKTPITLGTVFWARTDALKKLFEKEWKYTDFENEPLAEDGTINHAVERVLAYTAQDADYTTGWVMTDEYASEYMHTMRNALEKAFELLNDNLGIKFISEADTYDAEKAKLYDFCQKNRKTYIYGAGEYGYSCCKLLKSAGLTPAGFVVSNSDGKNQRIHNIDVYGIDDLKVETTDGIIIAVNYKYRNDIKKILEKMNIKGRTYMYDRLR